MKIRPDAPRPPAVERTQVERSRDTGSAARIVAPQKTPLSPADIRSALQTAHQSLKGTPIEPKLLDMLTAQVCTENASGAAMHNNNFGGIKGVSPEGATAKLRTREVLAGKNVEITDGFRAYSTPAAGAKDYLQLLERRFPRALEAARTGDVDAYAKSLKAGHYFTADAGEYAACMRGVIARGFDGEVAPSQAREPRTVSGLGPFSSLDMLGSNDAGGYATTLAVVRALDAVSASSARIAAPLEPLAR